MRKAILILLAGIGLVFLFIFGIYFYNKNIIDKSLSENDGEYVVLVHGLGRTSFSMQKLGKRLVEKGYRVVNIGYPSREKTIQKLVEENFKPELEEKNLDKGVKINFITHSMGGIIVRYFLQDEKPENLGKVIMLAPPNQGSQLAKKLSKYWVINKIMGPSLKQLSSDKNSFVNNINNPEYEVGIVAGQQDGKVLIEEAKLEGMKDFASVPVFHTWIMNNKVVFKNILNFLEKSKFNYEV